MLRACDNQWRVGFNGPEALDYAAIFRVAEKVLGIDITEEVYERLRVVEQEWLLVMSEKRAAAEEEAKRKAGPAGSRRKKAR